MTRLLRIKMAVAGVLGRYCGACGCAGHWLHDASRTHGVPLQVGHLKGRHWSIRRVNTLTRWRRYLREALAGKVQAECGPCNRKHGGALRYKKKDRTRQGARRKDPKAFYRRIAEKVEEAAAKNSAEFWRDSG